MANARAGACPGPRRRWRSSAPSSKVGGTQRFHPPVQSSSSALFLSPSSHATTRTPGEGNVFRRRCSSSGLGDGATAEQRRRPQQLRHSSSTAVQMLPLRHHRRGLSSLSRIKLEAMAGRDDGDDGSFDTDVVKDTELSGAATGDGASGAAEGWQGWVDGVVAKVKGALPEPAEAKKILPLGLMLFFILFDYTILRDTKVSRAFAAHAAMFAFRPTLHQQDYNCYKAGQRPKEERKGVSIYSSSCCTDPYHTTQISRGGGVHR